MIARISLPIYNAPECFNGSCHAHSPGEEVLGVMQLDVSYADIDEALRTSHTNLMILSLLIALLTSLIVWGLIHNWVSNPVKELLDGASRVADGDLQHNIPVGEAELGALALEFNKMQQKIFSGQRQLILIEKLASIGKLAASVAHEINNPMTGILTFAEDLVENAEPDDPRFPDFELIRDEAMRCRQIVGQLLDFSHQDTPILRPTSINEVVSKTIRFVAKQAFFRNIKVETEYQEDLPLVTADPVQLQQVILGVLVNAAEAMPDGGRISIASAALAETDEIAVSITDTGYGIPEENIEKIFEPFFSTKGGDTLGIGLAVSWDIMNNHGGSLVVDSKVGEGTTFKIILPWSDERDTAAAPK
jgi:two-component system NtrC family sensor kinase